MNKESQHEGWLIKSPPTKRIWRARWRRRWFTLKQGEIPEQFCLEYYTDRNCRKLKGVIDLDQCEQVDCGLRLENRKQKFQYMFDIKTPKRTYYLAADTEADMRDWVNCICQVCHLHDTKQSNELPDEQRAQILASTSGLTNSTNNTTTTSLNSSTGPSSVAGTTASSQRPTASNDLLRHSGSTASSNTNIIVVDRQPQASGVVRNNSDAAYVNTDYTNRETLVCDIHFDQQQLAAATVASSKAAATNTVAAATATAGNVVTTSTNNTSKLPSQQQQAPPSSPGHAVYLNSSVFQAQQASTGERLAVNVNGVVRKIPENLVLNQTPLPDAQPQSVQPSPALSTASGPYIPISECFSGSPKFTPDGNNPTTPLNNLDPKFYDTPRSHNNIGLNLTNDQSYSPKITNCSLQQITATKNRNHRSDSDSESVFTDDDEWAHPMPLRENVDRNTRPSDSSIENESFVVTYSQRFSKMPDEAGAKESNTATPKASSDSLDRLAKVLKNKNNLILDFKDASEKTPRDLPQFSDTENTSPAIGPRDSSSVVDEKYDIPRSHNLPYYNMVQMFGKITTPEANPIAASTPNIPPDLFTGLPGSPAYVTAVPRSHCYTNAAPSKVEGNVFRYDFIEQGELPPVNRKLKPKVNVEDKPPEEVPAKPPTASTPAPIDGLAGKLLGTKLQSTTSIRNENVAHMPPSVDRKLKPIAYKAGNSATLASPSRRSAGVPHSMVFSNDNENYVMETHTLPRQPRLHNYAVGGAQAAVQIYNNAPVHSSGLNVQHQRTASAAAAVSMQAAAATTATAAGVTPMQLAGKMEHKLQYFDLDVANPPAINRQSMSVGSLNAPGATRFGLSADPSARAAVKSSVVYNSVDFVKTEAFQRIREERKKESESNSSNSGSGANIGNTTNNATNSNSNCNK